MHTKDRGYIYEKIITNRVQKIYCFSRKNKIYTVTSTYFLYITIWTQNRRKFIIFIKKENMYELEDNLQIIILDIYSVDKE